MMSLFVIILVASGIAVAQTSLIGSTDLGLVPPIGHCELISTKLSDARLIGTTEDLYDKIGLRVIGIYAKCDQLQEWRIGNLLTLNDYAIAAYEISLKDFVYRGTDIEFVGEMDQRLVNQGLQALNDAAKSEADYVNDRIPLAELGEPQSLGIIGADKSAVYIGTIIGMTTVYGTHRVLLSSTGYVIIKKKILQTYMYSEYTEANVLRTLLMDHKDWTARLVAVNGKSPVTFRATAN